jgi:hypothetical protein
VGDEPSAVRVLKSKSFQRFARRCGIDDASLLDAVQRAERGLIDADLGSGVIKQRIARSGQGKSGGFRAIVFFRRGTRAVFVHGFEKSSQSNVEAWELKQFRTAARIVLDLADTEISRALDAGVYLEVQKGRKSDA